MLACIIIGGICGIAAASRQLLFLSLIFTQLIVKARRLASSADMVPAVTYAWLPHFRHNRFRKIYAPFGVNALGVGQVGAAFLA